MDLVLKGRGIRIGDHLRSTAEHKLAKLDRIHPRVGRVEVELTEANPRVDGGHRVEVVCRAGRHTFRAEATGRDAESALDHAIDKLERQMSSHRSKMRTRLIGRGNRLQSPGTSPEGPG